MLLAARSPRSAWRGGIAGLPDRARAGAGIPPRRMPLPEGQPGEPDGQRSDGRRRFPPSARGQAAYMAAHLLGSCGRARPPPERRRASDLKQPQAQPGQAMKAARCSASARSFAVVDASPAWNRGDDVAHRSSVPEAALEFGASRALRRSRMATAGARGRRASDLRSRGFAASDAAPLSAWCKGGELVPEFDGRGSA